jgi:hypothetical protein
MTGVVLNWCFPSRKTLSCIWWSTVLAVLMLATQREQDLGCQAKGLRRWILGTYHDLARWLARSGRGGDSGGASDFWVLTAPELRVEGLAQSSGCPT